MINFLTKSPVISLAPMDGYTDEPFRLLQTKIAKPDVIFTEFVSAEGISKGGVKLYDTLLYSSCERPIIGQLFGKDPESFYKSAIILCELGFDGIDINMGCPAKTVIQHGSGAALISKPELASAIIEAVQSGVNDWVNNKININDLKLNKKTLEIIKRNQKYSGLKISPFVKGRCPEGTERFYPTLSVKTRLGISESIVNTWIPHLLAHNLDFITLHGRTLKQGYAGKADWDEIKKAVAMTKNTKTLIWGNGDIQNRKQGLEYCQKYGVSGAMIGRAAFGNPWVFQDHTPSNKEKFSVMLLHAQLQQEVFPHRRFDILRKHFLLYTSGLPNAKQLRAKIIKLNSIKELMDLEQDFIT